MAITPNLFSLQFYKDLGAQAFSAAGGLVSTKLADIFNKVRTSLAQSQVVREALRETPQEFLQINAILKKAQTNPDALTVDEIQLTDGILQRLLANDSELLLEFVPHITVEELTLLIEASEWFAQMAEDLSFVDAPEEEFADAIEPENAGAIIAAPQRPAGHVLRLDLPSNQRLFETFDHLTDKLLKRTQGPVVRAKGYFAQKQGTAIHYLGKGATLVEQVKQMNARAHPLLVTYRRQMLALQSAVVANNPAAIPRIGRELQSTFYLIQSQAPVVFPQQFPTQPELDTLTQFNALTLPGLISSVAPAPAEMLTAIQPALEIVQSHYARHEGLLARTIATAEEKVTESVAARADAVVSRVLPKPAADFVLGRTPEVAPAPTPATPATTPPAAGEGSLSQFLAYGGSLLKSIFEKGTQAASTQALSSIASVLIFGISQALSKLEATPAFADTRAKLEAILGALKTAQTSGTWETIYNNLVDASKTLSSLKIYINGFRIPNLGSVKTSVDTAEGVYADNISALQTAMGSGPKAPESQDWETLAKEEKDKLVENSTQFLTMKHIYEDVCGLKPIDERFYIRLLMKAKKEQNVEEALKTLFFQELDNSKVPLLTQIWSRLQYFFYGNIVQYYIRKASTVYFDEIFKYIAKHKTENFDSLRNVFTRNFTRYLTILGGAYENVAAQPRPEKTLQEMLLVELDKKEANLGFESQELYFEFAKIVLEKTVGTGFLGWIAKKLLANPEEIVRAVIDKSLGSIQDTRGYTHALNSVFREQLEEIWKLLQADQAKRQTNPSSAPELSDVKKGELTGLVKNLFEILRKSKCQTKDELRDLIRGNLMREKVNQAVDDLFIEDVIEKVTNILALCVQTLVQEDQLQKLTYKFANLVNRTFDLGETVTLEQMQEEERKIAKLSSQILRLAVNGAVQEKFDFTGEKQQRETKRYVDDLQQRSTQFFTATGQDLEELSRLDVGSPAGLSKVDKIIADTLAYESESYEACFQSKGAALNSDNKDQISERHLGLAQASKPLVEEVKQLKEKSKKLESIQAVAPYLRQILAIMPVLGVGLTRNAIPTEDDLAYSSNQVFRLHTNIEELMKKEHWKPLVEQLQVEEKALATLIVDMKNHAKTALFCNAQIQGNSLIRQIADEKKQWLISRANGDGFKAKIATLKQQAMEAISDEALKPQFLAQLKTLEEATIAQQVDTAAQEFLRLSAAASASATRAIETHRATYRAIYDRINAAIEATHLLDANQIETAKSAIQQSVVQAKAHLLTLADWEKSHVKDVPFINFNPIDMKGAQDWASALVFDRVKEKLDGFMSFLKREETYRYGILNHLFLVPYVQAERRKIKV